VTENGTLIFEELGWSEDELKPLTYEEYRKRYKELSKKVPKEDKVKPRG
jgi:hypothetical protein